MFKSMTAEKKGDLTATRCLEGLLGEILLCLQTTWKHDGRLHVHLNKSQHFWINVIWLDETEVVSVVACLRLYLPVRLTAIRQFSLIYQEKRGVTNL